MSRNWTSLRRTGSLGRLLLFLSKTRPVEKGSHAFSERGASARSCPRSMACGNPATCGLDWRLGSTDKELNMLKRAILAATLLAVAWAHPTPAQAADKRYEPNWESLDQRPNPGWFDDDKIGIFIHWSVFSVPAVAWVYPDSPTASAATPAGTACTSTGSTRLSPPEQAKLEAFHRKTYGDVPFKALAPLFKAEAFDPHQWAELFKRSGARYAFLTSNFHDGYCLWPSPYSPGWNSMEVGPKRDLAGGLLPGDAESGPASRFLLLPRRVQPSALLKAKKPAAI